MAPTGTIVLGNSSWSKWQIALVVGAPVALGVGYWYLKRQSTQEKNSQVDDKDIKNTGSTAFKSEPSLSLDAAETTSTIVSAGANTAKKQEPTPQKIAQEFKNQGNQSFKSGNYAEAIASYNKAIEACPRENAKDLSTFYQNRAAAHEQLSNFEASRDDCTHALELKPDYVKALHRRSKAHESLGNLELSLEDITAACILENFGTESTLFMADRVLKALGRKHAKEAMLTRQPVMPSKTFIKTYFASFFEDPVTKQASMYATEETKNTNGDVTGTDGVSSKENGSDTLRPYLRAKQALKESNYEDVIEACTEEIEKGNGKYKSHAHLLRATFHLLQGEHHRALADFEKVIDDDEAQPDVKVNALIKRASLFMQLEDSTKSMQDFNRAAEIAPNNSDVFHHRGQVKLLLDDLKGAMDDFSRAVSLSPNFPIACVQKCYTDFRSAYSSQDMESVQKVTQRFEKAIQKYPNCTEAYTLYAQILTEQEEFTKADKLYARAVAVDPTNATVLVHRAILQLHWNQDIDKAVKMINDALALDNKCDFAYETLGTIEVQRANLSRAIQLFEKAIPLAKTELEMSHLFALKDAAIAQEIVAKRMGISIPQLAS